MIEQLFGSKTRVKLLRMFFSNQNRSFYVREITRKIDEQINSVRRELANLLNAGIITSDTTNNKLYYQVDESFPQFKALKSLLVDSYTEQSKNAEPTDEVVFVSPEAETLAKTGNVVRAYYTGRFTKDLSVDVDLVVIGDVNQKKLAEFVAEIEKKEKKEVRYVLMSQNEYAYRKQVNDRFITKVSIAKKEILIDTEKVGE
jgi:hypothetical protein